MSIDNKDSGREEILLEIHFHLQTNNLKFEISGVPLGDEEIKDRLLEALERRKRRFFECDAFIAALLLDPLINWSNNQEDFFGPELLERGMVHIEKIHQVLINRGQVEQLEDQNRDQQNVIYEALDQRLGGGRRGQDQSWQNINQRLTIRQQINRFLAEIRISSGAKLNPQKYWYNKRDKEPEIYKRCCNLPDLKQKTNISNLIMEYPELSNMTQEVVRCSKAKIYMEKSNLTSFDKSDFKNFIKDSTNDSEWIEAFNKAVDQCIDNLSHYKKILQQIHKVRDEDCDIRNVQQNLLSTLKSAKTQKIF
ncbi:unnamed protein product [Chironomus riparius]|uniref:Uncharacterized protein n=1 Tax=Chironomus riparius TaxID=315576 RepID=A0A9N9WZF0_9DIPT|nr:unnamed protein product [Chironomus riparius]